MAWDYRRYGSAGDPIHKSHLNTVTGEYGCLRKFRYQQDEAATNSQTGRRVAHGKAACGTAAHETIARALTNPEACAAILSGRAHWTHAQISKVFQDCLDVEVGDRELDWGKHKPATVQGDCVAMLLGLFARMHEYVAAVEQVESAFVVRLGDMWLAGHVDLVYRPKHNPALLALADWKTGAQRPDPIELDHGWEAGVYAAAVKHGTFLPRAAVTMTSTPDGWQASTHLAAAQHASRYRAERMALEATLTQIALGVTLNEFAALGLCAYGEFPAEIYHVHLADYVPYKRDAEREITRVDDLKHFGLDRPAKVKFRVGELHGPAWLAVKQTEHDIPRLTHRLRTVVGTIRMGRFIDMISARCNQCPYRVDCLNHGYQPVGDERRALADVMRDLPIDTLTIKDD